MDEVEVFDRRFEILRDGGEGGMGVVLHAKDREEGGLVALKYCKLDDEASQRRFAREIRVMASVNHENVMPVLAQNMDHDPPYFVMPLASTSIAEEIAGGLAEDDALDIFHSICLGAQAIHAAGGTHRDIKPENAMRLDDGRVVLADLGLIKMDPRDTTILTQTNHFVGTRMYCAPEQLLPAGSREADSRTDIYQLGKTLYELLTGDYPALIDQSRVPAGLSYIIDRATRQDPAQRYQSVDALMDAVRNYRLSKSPDANPGGAFEAALQAAVTLAEKGQYKRENLGALLAAMMRFQDDPEAFIDRFGEIPKNLVAKSAQAVPSELAVILEIYGRCLEECIGGYNFSYAETVAGAMKVIFDSASTVEVKAGAIRAALIAAVKLNRFAAMGVFDSMLTSIRENDIAAAVAHVLREAPGYYEAVAGRVPRNKLHPLLQSVRDAAT